MITIEQLEVFADSPEPAQALQWLIRSVGDEADLRKIKDPRELLSILDAHNELWRKLCETRKFLDPDAMEKFHEIQLPAVHRIWKGYRKEIETEALEVTPLGLGSK